MPVDRAGLQIIHFRPDGPSGWPQEWRNFSNRLKVGHVDLLFSSLHVDELKRKFEMFFDSMIKIWVL